MCNGYHGKGGSQCCPRGGRVRGFIQPWLLLLLVEKPTHGYELMERLGGDEEAPDPDPAFLYRTLRAFEREGLVRSSWSTEGRGAARRVYEITEEGLEYLRAWAASIRRSRARLDRFLAEYEARFGATEGR